MRKKDKKNKNRSCKLHEDMMTKISDETITEASSVLNHYPKSVWVTTENTSDPDRFKITLEVDGEFQVLENNLIIGLFSGEGIHLQSHNLTWLLNGRNELIENLQSKLDRAVGLLDICANNIHDENEEDSICDEISLFMESLEETQAQRKILKEIGGKIDK